MVEERASCNCLESRVGLLGIAAECAKVRDAKEDLAVTLLTSVVCS